MSFIIKRIIALVMSLVMMPFNLMGSVKKVMPDVALDFTMEAEIEEICDIVKENSYLDLKQIVTNLPSVSIPQKVLKYTCNVSLQSLRQKIREQEFKAKEEGNDLASLLLYTLGAVVEGIDGCHVKLVPRDDYYEFVLEIHYVDDFTENIYTGVFYNPETNEFFGEDGKGMGQIGYDFDLDDMLIKATVNGWMRSFGFCLEYDAFSYTTPFFFYHTRRFKFNYGDKEWMIQIWKGNYLVSNGSEVGVYNRNKGSFGSFYNCANNDDMLNMSLELWHGDEPIYQLEKTPHWWANGFKLTKDLYTANELTMKFSIEMKDEEMLKAFTESVDSNAFHDVTYTVDGLNVNLVW